MAAADLEAIQLLQRKRVLPERAYCDECDVEMTLCKDRCVCIYRCPSCKRAQSVRRGLSCAGSKLPLGTIVTIIMSWFDQNTMTLAAEKAESTLMTVSSWYRKCRLMCLAHTRETQPIGGPGKIVEIDETLVFHRKNDRGREKQQIWVVGGIERAEEQRQPNQPLRLFIDVVPNRNAETLNTLVSERVLRGTTIHTDKWGGYVDLNRLGFRHLTVNHRRNFVDPDTGAYTQTIEAVWKHLKGFLPKAGIRAANIQLYLAEFLYRKRLRPTRDRALRDVFHFDPSIPEGDEGDEDEWNEEEG